MSSSLPIGGFSSKVIPPSSDDSSKITPITSQQPSDQGKNEAGTLQTTKDLKIAELQGAPVSVGEEQVIKAIERANKALQGAMTSFEFSIHEKTHEIMVKVVDKESGETLREIPAEKTLDMVARMWELAGIVVDKKA
ncbi:flagellar protein FlaG [Paenibacillus sp. LjRoot56]|uniref:flagellar protein FlaG n=1 Tax=Paenibacillus sp. LjRoot56 TaxID=3342333 RepID=UPI003ECEEBEC